MKRRTVVLALSALAASTALVMPSFAQSDGLITIIVNNPANPY